MDAGAYSKTPSYGDVRVAHSRRPIRKKPAITSSDAQPLDPQSLLYAAIGRIQRTRGADQAFLEAAVAVRSVLGADYCALLTDWGAKGPRVRAWSGEPAVVRGVVDRLPPPAAEDDPRPVIGGPELAPDVLDRGGNVVSDREIPPVVRVPLLARGRVVGEVVVGRRASPLSESDIRLVELLAGHVGLAIWRAGADDDRVELLRRFEAERSVVESVVNQMPAGVLLADVPSGRILTSNPRIEAIWGRTLRYSARISDYAGWGGLDENGQPMDPEAWPLARAVLDGETVQDEEITIERPDGSRTVIRMSASPVRDSEGRRLGAVAVVEVAGGEWERERRAEDVAKAARTLGESLSLDATVGAVVEAMVGPLADWSVLYRGDAGVLAPVAATHRDADLAGTLRSMLAGGGVAREDHPVLRQALRGGEPVLLEDSGRPPFGGSGKDGGLQAAAERLGCESALVLPLLCRGRDIGVLVLARQRGRYTESDVARLTELAWHAAVALDNAALYEAARAADQAKANFLAVMSHEFRTPLSAILGYADILMARVHGDLNAKQQADLDRVKASVRHLTFLVDEILSFASMEAGRERVVLRETDLVALVADCVSLMEPIAEAAGLELTVEVPAEPLVVETDPPKVRQVVINLLSNALKYTLEGEVRVSLEADRDAVCCRVVDTGPGIAPEHAEHVFEPFWQVNRTGPGGTGTGLGLAVARRLARLMGGDVTLTSGVGLGSRFAVTLPRTPPGPDPEGE